jgi:hypothetical protein
MRRRDFIVILVGGHRVNVRSARTRAEPRNRSPERAFRCGAWRISSFLSRTEGNWLRPRAKRKYRIPLGRWSLRSSTLACSGIGDVSVIWANDVPLAFAAKAATKTIPIVFMSGADPIKVGLVESLSRPNGNLTGVSLFFSILGPKHVELLHELFRPSTRSDCSEFLVM